jgi:predicted XRE-type DNA-binding protein
LRPDTNRLDGWRMTMSEKTKHTKGSDNVFADLGVKNAGEHYLKSTLGILILKLMKAKNLKQIKAAALFGITQLEASRLKVRGKHEQNKKR